MTIEHLTTDEQMTAPNLQIEQSQRWTRLAASGALLLSAYLGSQVEPVAAESVAAHDQTGPEQTTNLVVETYNVLGANHEPAGHRVGGSVMARARRATDIIKGNTDVPRAAIVGFQEMINVSHQREDFNRLLPGYASEPTDLGAPNPIFYERSRFTLLEWHYLKYPYYQDHGLHPSNQGTEVRLQDKSTGQKFSVINVHAAAYNDEPGSDRGGAQKREAAADIEADRVQAIAKNKPNDAIITLNDFNATNNLRNHRREFKNYYKDDALQGDRSRLPYCIMTRPVTHLQSAYDLARQVTGHCPYTDHTFNSDRLVDWIFVSPKNVTVNNWSLDQEQIARHASDHYPEIADLTVTSAS